jgi:hypothetical protein
MIKKNNPDSAVNFLREASEWHSLQVEVEVTRVHLGQRGFLNIG